MEKADISLNLKRGRRNIQPQFYLCPFDSEESDGYAISFQPSIRPFAELKFTPIIRMGRPQDWNFS